MQTQTYFNRDKFPADLINPKRLETGFRPSSAVHPNSGKFLFLEYEAPKLSPFHTIEMVGTIISTVTPTTSFESKEDAYEVGYYNDDYDLVAKAPVTKSFKVKGKVKNLTKHHPQPFIDSDDLI